MENCRAGKKAQVQQNNTYSTQTKLNSAKKRNQTKTPKPVSDLLTLLDELIMVVNADTDSNGSRGRGGALQEGTENRRGQLGIERGKKEDA